VTAHCPRIAIAGTGSGVGKTTVTIGLMRALQRRGLAVQGFKCGPDYIDPTYHTAATGRASRNLDTWMLSPDIMTEIFLRGSAGADVSVIEGVMGLYDGKDPLSNRGSTAEISVLLECPVILVVNVQSMARSAAAVVKGYQMLDERVRIAGVIVNRCGSKNHYELVKAAIEQECGIPVVGWIARNEGLAIPERHLGLVPAIERGELNPLFNQAADLIEQGVNLEALLAIADRTPQLREPEQPLFVSVEPPGEPEPVIAVAKDAAFNFYYLENLELLECLGAKLIFFSPLAGDTVPDGADGVYLGGGFPEEFAAALADNQRLKEDLRQLVEAGMPVFAECGGYMYLCQSITGRSGDTHTMAGIIPAAITMQSKLAALGYREARAVDDCLLLPQGGTIRGHEFHYSTASASETAAYPYAYETQGMRGVKLEGYSRGNVLAGYTHVHLASEPSAAHRWIRACRAYGEQRRRRR
jgi:cobyrinic acid a,c-diamide synthase